MKYILEICGSLRIGGIEKVAQYIGLYLDSKNYHVDFVVFDQKCEAYEPKLVNHGCNVYHLPSPSKGYYQYMKNIKQILMINDYDVIHCHTMFSSAWPLMVSKKLGVPIRVVHSHNYKTIEEKLNIKDKIIHDIYETVMRKIILHCASQYIGCSQMAGDFFFGKKVFQEKGHLVLNGIDTKEFFYNEDRGMGIRKSLGIEDKFIIGNSARFTIVKNQKFLVELMPQILEKKSNAVLLLLGIGETHIEIKKRCEELGILDKVIMPGAVMNVSDYLSAMDVYVFPSLYEGMPLSIIEVQANGLPCVISDTVPPDVFLTDLIHPISLQEDADIWVNKICTIYRKESKKYGIEIQKTGFDARQMVEKIRQIYEE